MKKFAALLLTGVMAVSLAACGGSTGASSSAPAEEAVEEAAEEAVEETADDAAEAEAEAPSAEADAANDEAISIWRPTITQVLTLNWLRNFAIAAAGHWSRSPSTGTTRTLRSIPDPSTASGTA